jgi:phosphinothricin acetyltransferase
MREIIRDVVLQDSAQICAIYNYYVLNTNISFEEEQIAVEEMARRIDVVAQHYPWIVLERDDVVLGYAYASRWKDRSAYRFVAETTVYVDREHLREGAGTVLMQALLSRLAALDLHSLMAVIALPNEKSVAIHEKFGFKKAAHFTEVGFKRGTWIDVGYWQKML